MSQRAPVLKIVSGGQTGADRAALDFSIQHNIPHGGWVPKGRLAEDGTVPDCYQVKECDSDIYAHRTELNVRDSDATVIFTLGGELTGGSQTTAMFAMEHNKPCLHLFHAKMSVNKAADQLRDFINEHSVTYLNVAGSRASKEPHRAPVSSMHGDVLRGSG